MEFRRSPGVLLLLGLCLYFLISTAMGEPSTTPAGSEEVKNSSSDQETAEEASGETRRRRALVEDPELLVNTVSNLEPQDETGMDGGTTNGGTRAIPGLPDPATIIKLAEIIQDVGEKITPILVEGKPVVDEVIQHLNRDFHFLKTLRKRLDGFAKDLALANIFV